LQRIKKEQIALAELPIAQLTALMANINRDSKKAPKPFAISDFCLFGDLKSKNEEFPPEAAAIALELRRLGECPEPLIGCWPAILAAAAHSAHVPSVRVLWSDDRAAAILAPVWEGKNIRGTLVVSGGVCGEVILRDRDRPLLTYKVQLPPKSHFAYVSAGELVLAGS
jgi:hypothetical protein